MLYAIVARAIPIVSRPTSRMVAERPGTKNWWSSSRIAYVIAMIITIKSIFGFCFPSKDEISKKTVKQKNARMW